MGPEDATALSSDNFKKSKEIDDLGKTSKEMQKRAKSKDLEDNWSILGSNVESLFSKQ